MELIELNNRPDLLGPLRLLLEAYGRYMFEELGLIAGKESFYSDLAHLPGPSYQPPGGSFVLAFDAEQAIGCAAIKRWDDEHCELKRMFIKAEFRGRGLGKQLCHWAGEKARNLGYRSLLLDTNLEMSAAVGLYHRCGFERIEAYCSNANPHPVYMQLVLQKMQ